MRMNLFQVVPAVMILGAAAAFCSDEAMLAEQNRMLRERVERLEQELAALKALLAEKQPAQPSAKPTAKGMTIELYGYIKADAAYDSSRTSVGNYARWVESEATDPDDDQFSLTANQTRLGVQITAPELAELKAMGKVEIDFYGAGAGENRPEPLLRHAFVTATWPKWDLSLLAGQTSDIISPLTPPTINYSVGWWQGNIGYRRPQLRLTKEIHLTEKSCLKLEVGAARTIGRTNDCPAGFESGQLSGFPTVQSRASLSLPLFGNKPSVLGVSGHWGREDLGSSLALHSWSINADVSLPVTKWMTIHAEAFRGRDLDSYLGGIGQGYDSVRKAGVDAYGGWIAASLGPWCNWQLNCGAGCDNPADADLSSATARTLNSVIFANVWYAFSANLSLGLEISHLHTEYKNGSTGNSMREQFSVMYKF